MNAWTKLCNVPRTTLVWCPRCRNQHTIDARTAGHSQWDECQDCLAIDHKRFVEEMRRRGIEMGE